jgi:hypothetical protein
MRFTLLVIALCLFALPATSRAESVTCPGPNFAVRFDVPPGMKADITAGRAHDTCVMLEVLNTTFNNSPAVIYPSFATLDVPLLPNGRVDLDKFINNDVSNFRIKSPALLRIRVVHDIVTDHGDTFVVRDFLNGARPDSFEEAAYLPAGGAVLVFVLSTTNESDLEHYIPAFRSLLSHVSFVRCPH